MFNIAKKAVKVKRQFAQKPEKKWQNALTLIEIVIVVAIVLLLLAALYRTMGRNIDKARDTDRKSDLKEIKIAFENYHNDNDCYPPLESLEICDNTDLHPYLNQVPCDELGQHYLYLPVANSLGTTCGGYRVLTQLTILNDPMIKQVGCPNGCGNIPAEVANPEKYNYGIAEGVPLNQNIDDSEPIPVVDCKVDSCYCCPGPGHNCNFYNPATPWTCNIGPFTSLFACYASTSCNP